MAISASSYAVGNRVYKGATSAPTRGRVDPSGYVDRELNKVASNSRSGIAAAALRRMGGPSGSGGHGSQQPTSTTTQAAPQSQVAMTGQAKFSSGGGGLGAALRVSPIGKLQPPDLSGLTDLPFDPEKADAEEQLTLERNKFNNRAMQAEQDLERGYTLGKRQVETERPENVRRLLENYAGRGMAFSSGYNYDQGALSNEYANMLAQLEQQRTGGIEQLLRQRSEFDDDYGVRMAQIQRAAARRAAEKAAELELATNPPISPEQQKIIENYTPPPGEVPNYGPVDPHMPDQPGVAQGWRGIGAMPMTPGAPISGSSSAPASAPVGTGVTRHLNRRRR